MQSSLAIVLSLTLGFSPHPCVSIFGTGYCMISTRSFSWKLASMTSVLASAFHTHHAFAFMTAGFAWLSATSLAPAFPAAGSPSLLRHSFIHTVSTGISTCCPSATPLGLALGPDLPRADEPSSGNLGFSVRGILTHVPLPATHTGILSSIRSSAPSGTPSPHIERSPTTCLRKSIASVIYLAPVNYRRRVIRLVSCYALFKGWLLLSQPPSCLDISTSFST